MSHAGRRSIITNGLCVFTDPDTDFCLPDVKRVVDESETFGGRFIYNAARKRLLGPGENVIDYSIKFLGTETDPVPTSLFTNSRGEHFKTITTTNSPQNYYGIRRSNLAGFSWMSDFLTTRMFTGGKTWCIWIRPVPTNVADRSNVRIISHQNSFRLRAHPDDDTDPARLYLHMDLSSSDHIVTTNNAVLSFGAGYPMQFICFATDYTTSYIWHNGIPQPLTVISAGAGSFVSQPLNSILFGYDNETAIVGYYDIGMFLMYDRILSDSEIHELFEITKLKYL